MNRNSIHDREEALFTVTFQDHNQQTLIETVVLPGMDAKLPDYPQRDGYTFTGWVGNYQNVMQDEIVIAIYSQNPNHTMIPPITNFPVDPAAPLTSTIVALPITQFAFFPTSSNKLFDERSETTKQAVTTYTKRVESVGKLETPLAKGLKADNGWALFNLGAMLISVFIGMQMGLRKQGRYKAKLSKFREIFVGILGLASLVMFFTTQDVSQAVVFIDRWSFLMVAIIIVQIVILRVGTKFSIRFDKRLQRSK